MIAENLDRLRVHIEKSSNLQLVYQILVTLFVIYAIKRVYQLLFGFFYYDWEDKAMLDESSAEKRRREAKTRKRMGVSLPPFPNGWYKLVNSHELAPGQVKHVSALGKEWAVFRTASGKAALVGAYCPHIGADLSQGRVVGETLACPFHGFEFDSTGTCTKIPYQETVPSSLKCQDVLPIVEKNGAIIVWFDVDGKEPQYELPDVFNGEASKYKLVGHTRHLAHTHIQEILENGADSAHLPIVHERTIFKVPILTHQWNIKWAIHDKFKHMTQFSVDEIMTLYSHRIPGTTFSVEGNHIGPGFVHFRIQTMFGALVVSHQVTPLEGFLQQSEYLMWKTRWVPQWYAKIVMRAWVDQLEKDVVIWNQKVYLPAAQIVKNDGPMVVYRRWFKQFYSDKGTQKKTDFSSPDLF